MLLAVKRVNKSDKIADKGNSAVQGCHASVLIGNGNAITMAGMAILAFIEGWYTPHRRYKAAVTNDSSDSRRVATGRLKPKG